MPRNQKGDKYSVAPNKGSESPTCGSWCVVFPPPSRVTCSEPSAQRVYPVASGIPASGTFREMPRASGARRCPNQAFNRATLCSATESSLML